MATIVFPMAGHSRRFAQAGYRRPKYALELGARTVFAHAVGSFSGLFDRHQFVFVMREDPEVRRFVVGELARLGVRNYRLVGLTSSTRGQAETVAIGLQNADIPADEALMVFNIDTFRPGFRPPAWTEAPDGYLEVFRAEGTCWSFAEVEPGSDRVRRTTEKLRISELCCTGLYQFASRSAFDWAYLAEVECPSQSLSERYVAPMYNKLIARGDVIRCHEIAREELVVCGTPDDYEALRAGGYGLREFAFEPEVRAA